MLLLHLLSHHLTHMYTVFIENLKSSMIEDEMPPRLIS